MNEDLNVMGWQLIVVGLIVGLIVGAAIVDAVRKWRKRK